MRFTDRRAPLHLRDRYIRTPRTKDVLDETITLMYSSSMPTDTDTTAEIDLSKLEKIRALLDKAESTANEFPAEAEALTAKAIEMMERYRIDKAMIADARPLQDRGKIIEKRILIGAGPYVNARMCLATVIATAHSVNVSVGTTYKGKMLYLVGYESDLELTDMLYTSLLVQATRSMNSAEVKATKPTYEHGTAFCRSFLLSFADIIGRRLEAATRVASDEQDSGRSVALVLADRKTAVDEDALRRYGKLRAARPITGSSSAAGSVAGFQAGQKADLGTNRRVNGARTKSLVA